MSRDRLFLGFSSVLFPALLMVVSPGEGRAQVCSSNAGCPKGTTCQVSTTIEPVAPTSAPCPRDVKDCVTAESAPAPVPAAAPVTRMTCQPITCTADVDCDAGMVCFTQTFDECSGGTGVASPACPPNADCPSLSPPSGAGSSSAAVCTTKRVSTCAFKWQLPCNADAECGSEFVCAPTVSGTCSSSGSVDGGGAGGSSGVNPPPVNVAAPAGSATSTPTTPATGRTNPAPAPECTTTTSFPGWCRPKAATCKVDSDCPANWTCVSAGGPSVASDSPVSSGPGTTGATTVSSAPSGTSAAVAGKVCSSPYAFFGGSKESSSSSGGVSVGPAPDATGNGSTSSPAPGVPGQGSGVASDSTGGPRDPIVTLAPATPTSAEGKGKDDGKQASAGGDAGGCSVAAAGDHQITGAGVTLTVMAMLLAFWFRRARIPPQSGATRIVLDRAGATGNRAR